MYHVNAQGEPGQCKAMVQCPFGSADEHHETADDARAAYEARMSSTEVPAPVERHKCDRCGGQFAYVGGDPNECPSCIEYNTCEQCGERHNLDGYCDHCD